MRIKRYAKLLFLSCFLIISSCSDMISQHGNNNPTSPDIPNSTPLPTGSMVINSNDHYTTSSNVILSITHDNATEMCFSNDNNTWSPWEPVSGSKNWTLAGAPQSQEVYCKLKNSDNTITCSDTIIPLIESKITASDGVNNDYFGGGNWGYTTSNLVLSEDGKTVITARFLNNNRKVYIYKWINNTWQESTILSPDPTGSYFGNSLDCTSDGNSIIIGDINKAKAYLFEWNGSSYSLAETFTSPTPAVFNDFAVTVAISDSGNRVVIGSWKNESKGAVYIYNKSGITWNLSPTKITANDGTTNDIFGLGVNISGDGNTVAVGSPLKENREGKLYVFKWNGSNWILHSDFKANGTVYDDLIGRYISLSYDGTAIVAGTRFWELGNSDPGSAFIFQWNGISWDEIELQPSGSYSNDKFGYGVSMSSDGQTVAVSSPGPMLAGNGVAYLYRYNGSSWVEEEHIDGPLDTSDFYGNNISISGDGSTIAVGAPGDDSSKGAVYVY